MRQRFISSGIFTALCGLAALAFAADVGDFARASKKEGCRAIPYLYTENECDRYQAEKDLACHGYGSEHVSFNKFTAKIEDDKRKLEEAKSRNNRSAIPGLEASITTNREKAKRIQAKALGKIQKCNECIAARKRVQRVFKDATTSVKADGNAVPEIKPYADILVAKYEKGAAEHVGPIVQVENAKQNWLDVQKVTIP